MRLLTSIVVGVVVLAATVFALQPEQEASAGVTGALFSLHCRYSHSAPDDPIVFPGQPGASHMHDFMGNDSTDAGSTYDEMQASTTKCKVTADKAGYWIPALYQANGTKIKPNNMNLYYRNGPGGSTPFPADLRMVARASNSYDTGWACGGKRPFTQTIPDCTGKLPIRAHVTFPSCWNGAAMTHTDDTANLAQAAQPSLACPAGFPIRLPRIQLNVSYAGAPHTCVGCYLSSGDPSTLHSDFWNTWDQPTLEHLVAVINTGKTCHDLRDGDPCLTP